MTETAAPLFDQRALLRRLEPVFAEAFSNDLERAYAHLDGLCLQLCFRVANDCELLRTRAEPLADIVARVGVAEDAAYLARAILDILCEEGFAQCDAEGYRSLRQCPDDDSERLQREARKECPGAAPIFEMIARCHQRAVHFITGATTGMSVIFERGDISLWERLHTVDRVMSLYADLAPVALELIARPRMRLLEVGGGVGGVLQRLLPMRDRLGFDRYVFSDLGQSFVQNAQRRYGADERIGFARIDLDLSLRDQGLPAEGFDAVIAVNVLHAVKNLSFSLRELRQVLKPLGCLLLSEGAPPGRFRRWRLDVVFGFLRGGWDVSVEPPWRAFPGFLSPLQWKGALSAAGYGPVCLLPGEDWFRGPCRGGAVLAQKPLS